MPDLEGARLLLEMARKDLTALTGMDDPKVFSAEIFGFHAQQVVEKALKAWMSLAGLQYPRTHDLGELTRILDAQGYSIPDYLHELEYLTDFAVQFRYLAFDELDEPMDRALVTSQATQLLDHVERLGSDSQA